MDDSHLDSLRIRLIAQRKRASETVANCDRQIASLEALIVQNRQRDFVSEEAKPPKK